VTHERWATFTSREPETLEWIDTAVQDGDILFDVGANIGVYAIYAALRHPRAKVIAIEPEYANVHLLRDNIVKNDLKDRIEAYSIAFSNHSGLSHLYIQDLTPGASLHTESRQSLAVTRMKEPVLWGEGIAILTLDLFCEELGVWPDCLKVDVDGTEAEILEGAQKTLRSGNLRSITIEMPYDPLVRARCRQLLEEADWRCARQSNGTPNQVWTKKGASS
jgi:FkbM family methyltransferase